MRNFLVVAAVALLLLDAPRALADAFDIISVQTPSPNTEIVTISQPNVKQAMTQYPTITFKPGDSVVVTASGCVQTGGTGATWKLYVSPEGSESDKYYFGEVWIPGATGALVPIASVYGKTLTIPENTPPGGLYLRLGYTDDNYSDNGYYSHDNGNNDQCKDVGAAQVQLKITHNAVASSTPAPPVMYAPFDLIVGDVDDNYIPLQARWGQDLDWQNNLGGYSDPYPGDNSCSIPYQRPCTTQTPSLDTSSAPNSWFSCDWLGGPMNGHANWGPGTYAGTLTWESKSPDGLDDDYSIDYTTTNYEGGTQGREYGFHTEFDSDEVIDHMNNSWWNTLHAAADGKPGPTAQYLLNGDPAVLTGLVDLDCAHPCSGELHPVWAFAAMVSHDNVNQQWAIFVRNWGDEGGCSSDDHQLQLPNNQYSVMLPWPAGGTAATVTNATTFESTADASFGGVTMIPGTGIELTFNLASPAAHSMVDGVFAVTYTMRQTPPGITSVMKVAPMRTKPAPKQKPGAAGEDDEYAFPLMTATQLALYRAKFPDPTDAPKTTRLSIPAATTITQSAYRERRKVRRTPPAVVDVVDTAKLARDEARITALYGAFGGAVPGHSPLPRTKPQKPNL